MNKRVRSRKNKANYLIETRGDKFYLQGPHEIEKCWSVDTHGLIKVKGGGKIFVSHRHC